MPRIFVAVPVIVLLLITSMVFLVAKAPRTWAANWTSPTRNGISGGGADFGALTDGHGWDLLWLNEDTGQLVYSRHAGGQNDAATVLDSGDVVQPTLTRVGAYQFGAWVHNFNGYTTLKVALFVPGKRPRIRSLFTSVHPMEHPFAFAGPRGEAELLFSWQRFANTDIFQTSIDVSTLQRQTINRLTHSAIYGFYPRGVLESDGNLAVIHLERCCEQQQWHVVYDRYDQHGHHLGSTRLLAGLDYGQQAPDPSRWGEDIGRAPDGTIWGAFTGVSGVWLFHAGRDGRILQKPTFIGSDSQAPPGVTLALTRSTNYVFWEEPFPLGSFIESRQFDQKFNLGIDERVEYLSNAQVEPHAGLLLGSRPGVIWQTVSNDLSSHFNSAANRPTATPTLAERLGLGLTDPWQAAAVLIIGAFGLATLLTTVNVFFVVGLALLGMLVMRLFRRFPGRWAIFGLILSALMYVIFVNPGVPTLFLASLPSMGFANVPFGILAALGSLAFVSWIGMTSLRRIDDIYRAGIMAFLAIYFFAFVETAVFIQQRLGVI